MAHRHPVLAGVLAGLLVLVAGLAYTVLQPTTYTSTSTFALLPRDPATTGADTTELVGRSYLAYLSSPDVLGRVAQSTGDSREMLAEVTDVAIEADSANLQTSVTLPDAARAAVIANEMSGAGIAKARADALVAPDLVSPAVPDAAAEHPPRMLLGAASVLAALLAGALVAYVLGNRYRSERERSANPAEQ